MLKKGGVIRDVNSLVDFRGIEIVDFTTGITKRNQVLGTEYTGEFGGFALLFINL